MDDFKDPGLAVTRKDRLQVRDWQALEYPVRIPNHARKARHATKAKGQNRTATDTHGNMTIRT